MLCVCQGCEEDGLSINPPLVLRDDAACGLSPLHVCLLSFSRSLWNPRGHCERPGDRRELWLPGYGRVSVSARLSTDRLISSHLSPRQPVVWTAARLHT